MEGKEPLRKNNTNEAWWRPALLMFFRLSSWIIAPVLIGIFLGKWLDKKYNTSPWLFLFCVGLAFIISMIGLVKSTMEEFKKIDKSGSDKKDKDNKI